LQPQRDSGREHRDRRRVLDRTDDEHRDERACRAGDQDFD